MALAQGDGRARPEVVDPVAALVQIAGMAHDELWLTGVDHFELAGPAKE
jgi:hypothetical protein